MTTIAIPTFRGFLNARKTAMKKAKGELSQKAQMYFKDTTRPHASCQNVLVYKLDNTGFMCFDTDDKASNDYVEAVMEKYNVPANRNKSVSNVFTPTEGENSYKFHYWFRTEKKIEKRIQINGTNLDILTKELVFEPIVEDQFEIENAPTLTDEIYNEIMRFGAKLENIPAAAAAILFAEPVPEPIEETVIEPVETDEAKALIDANTTVKEAKSYGTWSKVMFKIANKYGKTAQGLEMAIYFSQKDKKQFKMEDVKTFWEKIDLSKVQYCEFGLSEVEIRLQKEEAKKALMEIIKQEKKEEKKSKEEQGKETQKKILINDLRVSTFYICTENVEKQIRNYKVAIQS
jgi:hypothetical protein